MKIYLKDGTTIYMENDPGIIVDMTGIDGYVNVKKEMQDRQTYYNMLTMPKESLNFIDWGNSEEAGVKKYLGVKLNGRR